MSLSVSCWKITLTYLAKVAFLSLIWDACSALMRSVFFTAIELTCLIESISTNNPRIEWKKIKNGIPSYVYFQNRIAGKTLGSPLFENPINQLDHSISKQCLRTQSLAEWMVPWKNLALNSVFLNCEVTLCMWMSNCKVFFFSLSKGDLEHRAQLREPANILIYNTTRSDTAEYRCEVAAIDDQRDFDEILISLAVRGMVSGYFAGIPHHWPDRLPAHLYFNSCGQTDEQKTGVNFWNQRFFFIYKYRINILGFSGC